MVWGHDRTASPFVAILMRAILSASTVILQPLSPGTGLTRNLALAAAIWIGVGVVILTGRVGVRRQRLRKRAA